MDKQLAVIPDFDTTQRMSMALYKSGYFSDVKSEAQAIVKVLAGQELGLPPFASMTGIHIIKGKPVLGSNVIATLVKNDPRYDYQITTATDETCTIEWYEDKVSSGFSQFTITEAKRAGLASRDNWQKYPSDMLFARAISRGARRYAPGIFGGAPVYTPDELGAEVDPDGYVIEGETVDTVDEPAPTGNGQAPVVETTEPAPADEPLFNGNVADARAWLEEKGQTTLGIVADALVMTGLYNDREHVKNALDGDDGAELRDKGLVVDMRRKVKATLVIFDWAVDRKKAEASDG